MPTTSYSPATATALTMGATDDGFVATSSVPWDLPVSRLCAAAAEQRRGLELLHRRDTDADLRRRLRALAGTPTRPLRVLGVGDSITLGIGSSDGAGVWPWLADVLDRQDIALQAPLCAVGAVTLRALAPQVPAALAAAQPDVVVIHLGTNDAAQPDVADWQARYGALVDVVLASSPTVRVVCAKIQQAWGSTSAFDQIPNTINPAVTATVNARLATGRVVLADLTGWGLSGPATDQTHTIDGCHPMDAGYLRMARVYAATLQQAGWLP